MYRLAAGLSLGFEVNFERGDERLDILLRDFPNDPEVNRPVIMGDAVAQPAQAGEGDVRQCGDGGGVNLVRGFSDHRQSQADGIPLFA